MTKQIKIGRDSKLKKEDELYIDIEHAIIKWSIDGTKTAGELTREIMKIIIKINN